MRLRNPVTVFSMNLITWNIQWCCGCDGRVDPKRIVDTCREMADVDVLCLQEVARNYPGMPGSSGEDQFALLHTLLPGFTAVEGVAVDTLGNFGSTVLDNYGTVRISVCDHCLVERRDRIRLVVQGRCETCHEKKRGGFDLVSVPDDTIPAVKPAILRS